MKPFISVIIPTYQRREKLKNTLKSLLSQTYKNYEVLVIDDGSTDGTREMVSLFKDKRIIYNWQNNSGCPASPRNKGIHISKGDWIAFLDSDDAWEKNKLEVCYRHINFQVDFIYHDMQIKSADGHLNGKNIISRQLKKPVLKDLLINGNIIINSSVLVRKKLLKKIGGICEHKKLIAAEDYNTWLKISKLTNKFLYLPCTLGYYSKHNQNLSIKNMSIPKRYAVKEFLNELTDKEKFKLNNNLIYTSARYNYFTKKYKKAEQEFWMVFKNGSLILKIKSLIRVFLIATIIKIKN